MLALDSARRHHGEAGFNDLAASHADISPEGIAKEMERIAQRGGGASATSR